MRKDNGIIVYEETDKCALDEYSEQLAKDIEQKFKDEAYDDTEIKQDISNIQAEQETQNINIESLQKENAEIKEENKRLKDDLNAFPTVNGSGEYVTLDTADSRFKKFKIFGKSWQETRIGKNAIIFEDVESTISGIAYSIKNGVVTLNGTATGVMNIYSKPINLLAGDYTLSKNVEGTFDKGTATSTPAILLQKKQEDGSYQTYSKCEIGASAKNNFISKTLEKGTYRLRIFTATGNILNNFSWKPQLEQGAVFSGFEQGGAMPSAEFPSEIRNVGDNGNLYDKDNPNVLDTPIDNNELGGNVKNTYKTVWIKCKSNTTYTVSKKYDATKNRFALAYTSEEPNYSQRVEGYTSNMYASSLTIKTNSTAKYLLAYVWIVGGSVTYQEMLDSIKIEKGTQATLDNGHGLGSMGIVIGNKNLLDAEKIVKNSNNERFVYFDENKNVVFTTGAVPVIVRPVKIKEKTEYTYILRCKSNTTKLNNINFIAKYTDGSQEVLSANKRTDTNEFVAKFKTNKEKTLDYVTQSYTDSASTTLIADASMILEGDYSNVNIELDNAKKQVAIFPFKKGQRLMKGDYLAEDGIHHKRKQTVLDGTENWQQYKNRIYLYIENAVNIVSSEEIPDIKSNMFKPIQFNNISSSPDNSITYNLIGNSEKHKGISFYTNKYFNDVSTIKSWLAQQKQAETPVTVEYELAEEEVESYTETQKEAWKQIKNAKSYEGQTNIFSTDEISPNFEVTARRNLNAILNSLQAQILAN